MKQRGFAILPILPHLIGGLVLGALVWWAYSTVTTWYHGLCNNRCEAAEQRALTAESAIEAAQARATFLALKWAEAIQKVEVRYIEVVKTRTIRVESVRESAGKIKDATDAVPVPVPGDARRVLEDVERIANDTPAASGDSQPSQAVPEAADSTLTDWIAFSIAAGEAYADAREKHQACVAWAASISEAQAAASSE